MTTETPGTEDPFADGAELEFEIPDSDYWTYPQARDWVLHHTSITDPQKIIYAKLRGLATSRMHRRRVSFDRLRWMCSDTAENPIGESTFRRHINALRRVGLVEIAEDDVHVKRERDANGKFVAVKQYLLRLNQYPAEGRSYQGWHTTFDKFEAYPGEGWDKKEKPRSGQRSKMSDGKSWTDQQELDLSAGHTTSPARSKSSTTRSKMSDGRSKMSGDDAQASTNAGVGEPSRRGPLERDSLRSSVPRASAAEPCAGGGGDERTNEAGCSNAKKNREGTVRGADLHTVRLEGQTVEVTDEHRALAAGLGQELGLHGGEALDVDLRSAVVECTGMWTAQQRDLAALLPRAVAAADGNVDAVRGFLMSKADSATRATFVLDAFLDEHIGDVHYCTELASVATRLEDQRKAEEAAQRHEEWLNRRAAGDRSAAPPWAAAERSERPRAADDEGGAGGFSAEDTTVAAPVAPEQPDPAQEVAVAAALSFELTRRDCGVLRVVLAECGHEPVVGAIKHVMANEGEDGLRRNLRNAAVLRRTVAAASC